MHALGSTKKKDPNKFGNAGLTREIAATHFRPQKLHYVCGSPITTIISLWKKKQHQELELVIVKYLKTNKALYIKWAHIIGKTKNKIKWND